jgi:hypothetical protein
MSKRLGAALSGIAVLNVIGGIVMWILGRGQYGSPMILAGLAALVAIQFWMRRPPA